MASEKRLIYADSGQESVEYLKRHLVVGDSDFLRGYLQGAETLADGLAKLQPVDAVEVVHGRWEQVQRWATKAKYRCSVCGREIMSATTVNIEKYPYCHCGAKMDGDGNG